MAKMPLTWHALTLCGGKGMQVRHTVLLLGIHLVCSRVKEQDGKMAVQRQGRVAVGVTYPGRNKFYNDSMAHPRGGKACNRTGCMESCGGSGPLLGCADRGLGHHRPGPEAATGHSAPHPGVLRMPRG